MTFDEYVISIEKIIDKLLRLSQSLADMVKDANSKVKTMKSLLERLAPEECPITKTNVGVLEITRCKYCDTITTMWGECNHAPDCPWVEARKLLEGIRNEN